ncbi:MAG: hypothetical protein AAF870_05480 [Pseudomonadota bacterium]
MSQDNNQAKPNRFGHKSVPDIWLGKRHDCAEPDEQALTQTAQILGFSPKEILELERVYQTKAKK